MNRRRAAILVVLVAALGGPPRTASAGERALRTGRFAFSLLLQTSYQRILDPERVDGLENLGSIGMRARLALGRRVAYCAGFDFEAGGGDGGALYDIGVLPVGGSIRFGRHGVLGICAGVGVGGVIGAVPVAAQFPIEASLELDIGPARVLAWSRPQWILGREERDGGARIADEWQSGFGLRWGKRIDNIHGGARVGNGYYLGATYRESMGARSVGVTFGYGVSGAR